MVGFVGLDLGSSTTKAVVLAEDGSILGRGRSVARLRRPTDEVSEYDAEELLESALDAGAQAVRSSGLPKPAIAAVGLDGMISGALGVDRRGAPTTSYTTLMDRRHIRHAEAVVERVGRRLIERTGSHQPYLGPKVTWIKNEYPDVDKRTAKWLPITAFVGMRVTGANPSAAVMDWTQIWATGVADARTRTWDPELCDAFGVEEPTLPDICEPTRCIGGLCPAAAERLGLRVGTPVTVGVGDQQAAFVAIDVSRSEHLADVSGTYPNLFGVVADFRPDVEAEIVEVLPSVNLGTWHPATYVIGGGLTRQWARNILLGPDAADRPGDAHPRLEQLEAATSRIPAGAGGVVFVPHLGGRACPPEPLMRGGWIGASWQHTAADLYRAVLESIAFDHALGLRRMKELYPELRPQAVLAYGGGAVSDLWCQIKADVCGLPYLRVAERDLAPIGAAMLARELVSRKGGWPPATVTIEKTFDPQPRVHDLYAERVTEYERTLKALEGLYGRV